ncbi:MAG: hypothetical protein NWR53_01270 [Crocinitomicaceae bacterium]|jgi:hypothetical protein|nr:hypothetical protein [Crocinitomicaceae bacterium]
MKQLILSLSFITSSMIALAQSGVIYNFAFKIDDALVTQMKTQNKEYKILNLATIEDLPKELSDTILLVSEQMLGSHLNAVLTSMRPEEKVLMGALPEHLLYLPANTFKKAIKNSDTLNYYIDIACHIAASGGVKVTLANNSFSKVKPKLSLTIKIYDKEKLLIEEKDVVLKDFEKLRSHTFEDSYGIQGLKQNTDVVTVSETIDANDVLRMYVMALVEATKVP